MDWEKLILGSIGGAFALNLISNWVSGVPKVLWGFARKWHEAQRRRDQESAAETAARLASNTQALIIWIGAMVLTVLSMLTLALAAGIFGLGYARGWTVWAPAVLAALFTLGFAQRCVTTLVATLQEMRRQEAQRPPEPSMLTAPTECSAAALIVSQRGPDPTPSPGDAGQQRGS